MIRANSITFRDLPWIGVWAVALIYAGRVVLALAGVLDPINQDASYLPAPDYLSAVAIHCFYGVALFYGLVLSGAFVLRALATICGLDRNDVAVFALPVGLVVGLSLALVSFWNWVGGVLAASLLIIVTVGHTVLDRMPDKSFDVPFRQMSGATLFAVTLGALQALIWRPPTAVRDGSVQLGDLTVYAAIYHALKKSIYPFFNFGSEGERFDLYFNQLHTVYALALDFLPQFEIYLYLSATLSTFFILSIAYLLVALARYRRQSPCPPLPGDHVWLVVVLFIAAARYPSWIIETPPAVFLTPIVLALCYAVDRATGNPVRLGFALAFAFVGTAISKVVALAVLGTYAGLELCRSVLRGSGILPLFWLAAGGIMLAGYVGVMFWIYGDRFFPEMSPGPEPWVRLQSLGWRDFGNIVTMLVRDLGLVVVLVGAARFKRQALFLAVLVGVASHLLYPLLFTSMPATVLILIAGTILLRGDLPRSAYWPLLVGSLMFLPHHLYREPGDWHSGLIWMLTLGPAVWVSLRAGEVIQPVPAVSRSVAGRFGPFVAYGALAGLTVVAVATGDLRLGETNRQIGTSSLYRLWEQTRTLTPEDSLIFTDQTGNDPGRLTGWNDFAAMSQRQFYLASWSMSELRYDEPLRKQRLANSENVLQGTLAPSSLALSRHYSGFYAAVDRDHSVPAHFEKLYVNEDYILYRIHEAGAP